MTLVAYGRLAGAMRHCTNPDFATVIRIASAMILGCSKNWGVQMFGSDCFSRKIVFGLSFIIGASSSGTATDVDIASHFSAFEAQKTPGCNVGIIEKGELVHQAGYGIANMELDVPLDGSQVHRMASVSKQFTAMAVLLLAEEGKIDLDEDIRSYLPDLMDYTEKVTVNQMLGHVSGMGDYDLIAASYEGPKAESSIELKSAAGGPFRLGNEDYLTIQEFYDVMKNVPLKHEPNAKFYYSNNAYFLLSMLVEKVTGESLRAYAKKRIFEPLGMDTTFFSDDPVEIVKNRASGYKKNTSGEFVTDMTNLFWVGDGGLHTNLEDMLKWDQNFYRPKIGKNPKQLIALLNQPNSDHKTQDGSYYANGQFVENLYGHLSYSHSGGWLGTSTYYSRTPDKGISVILMCNDAGIDPEAMGKKLQEHLLK